MLRSLSTAVSGMRNHQTRMDVIADNIANVNTTSYKYARVNFKDVLSQNLRGNSISQVGVNSINPSQVGLGMAVGSIDRIFTQGAMNTTNRSTDLAIDGNGFFVVVEMDNPSDNPEGTGNIEELYLTRDGAFYINEAGYLVDSMGRYVLGINDNDPYGDGTDDISTINLKDPDLDGTNDFEYIESVSVDREGAITVNGKSIDINVGLYHHENPEGLVKLGNNLYENPGVNLTDTGTQNDGLNIGRAGGCGDILSGNLEMSNVELSREFADMIVTQRGFQANARVITVSDQMLQELVELKR